MLLIHIRSTVPCASWLTGSLTLGLLMASQLSAIAQITSDRTLPTPSQLTPDGTRVLIEGGTQSGNNLFECN